MLIGLFIAIVVVLVAFFLVEYLCALLLGSDPSTKCDELRVKRSDLEATLQRYGLDSEVELREYLWFNCGVVLIIEED